MIVTLPEPWLVAVDVLAWPVLHLAAAWTFTRLDARRFNPSGWLFRPRRFEQGGELYDRVFAVRRWKRRLPDGAALFRGGFRKRRFESRDPAYLARFRVETCRAEAAHWTTLAAAPLFFLFNPPWAGGVMLAYAVLANLPCIVVQRYNRLRLGPA